MWSHKQFINEFVFVDSVVTLHVFLHVTPVKTKQISEHCMNFFSHAPLQISGNPVIPIVQQVNRMRSYQRKKNVQEQHGGEEAALPPSTLRAIMKVEVLSFKKKNPSLPADITSARLVLHTSLCHICLDSTPIKTRLENV